MPNSARSNAPFSRSAFRASSPTSTQCDIPLGQVGLWWNNGAATFRDASGVDHVAASLNSLPVFGAVCKTAVALPACTYDNGTLGVGATLTANAVGIGGAIGGVTPGLNAVVLVDQQVSTLQNGLYTVTALGTASLPRILTRLVGFDTFDTIIDGAIVVVQTGTSAGLVYEQTDTVATVGTDAIEFALASSAVTFAAVNTALAAANATIDINSQALTGVKSVAYKSTTTLTIATGAVTATQSIHALDTESAAASDDLDTISGMVIGNWYRFKIVAAARNVVFKHGTGNLLCWGNQDITLDVTADSAAVYYDGTNGQVFPAGLATAPRTGATAPTFTGTTPVAAFNATALFSGTGQSSSGQVITTTDNQTMTLNQCAGMLFISATHGPYYIASNTAVTGAPAVLTIYGTAPTTDAGSYKIINGLTPVGTVSSHTHSA